MFACPGRRETLEGFGELFKLVCLNSSRASRLAPGVTIVGSCVAELAGGSLAALGLALHLPGDESLPVFQALV